MKELTERQREVYEFISLYSERSGYPPTMQEIAAHLGVSGNGGVIKHLDALERKGLLTRSTGSSRGIRLIRRGGAAGVGSGEDASALFLPVVGTVRAGMPHPPVEDIQQYYSIDRSVARSGGTFFLKVKGDSMINACIREGDLALIRPQQTAEDRDIVVALVDGEATLKRFYREKDRIRLQPENPNYPPIIVAHGSGEIAILGKVVGIYRTVA